MEWVTEAFRRRVVGAFKQEGAEWLMRLPDLVADYERNWSLKVIGPVGELSYNFVALARQKDGSLAVLKLGVPTPGLLAEMAALGYFAGNGVARLLESDRQAGAMLIEYVQPGRPLSLLDDDQRATEIAVRVMLRLRRSDPGDPLLPTLTHFEEGFARLRTRFDGATGPLPERLVSRAERLFAELLASTGENMLMHGDLHHFNILETGGGEWLAIDPFGVVGDPGYEVGAFLYNPMPDFPQRPGLKRALNQRLDILSEGLGMERDRLAAWGFAQAVLSACWSIEDDDPMWQQAIRVAEELNAEK